MPRHEERYMERSEKRSSYNRVPRKPKKQPGRSFFYGLLAIVVALILWPVGMVMLWTRKLRWNVGVKLIASMLTLVLCLCWIGFALTVQTDDPRITYVQDRINGFLAESAEFAVERTEDVKDNVMYVAGELKEFAAAKLPGAAEWTNDTINEGKNSVLGLVGIEPEVTPTPEPTAEPTEAPTDEPTAEPEATDEPEVSPEAADGTPAPARVTSEPRKLDVEADPTPAPTVKPAGEATVYHSSNGVSYHEAPDCVGLRGAKGYTLAESVADGFKACGNCNPPAKSLLNSEDTVMWQDELNVIHISDECYNFTGKYTLVELSDVDDEAMACPMCGATSYASELTVSLIYVTPEPTEGAEDEPTDEPTAEPTDEPADESSEEPTDVPSDEPTGEPTDEPSEEPTAEPTEDPTDEPTEEPTGDPTDEPTEEPTGEPTDEPTEEPTEEPTAEPTEEPTAEPSAEPTLKPAGEAIVYHTSNGVGYHRASRCIGMSSAKPYTLAESVADGLRACGNCDVPDASILDADEPVLWVDASDIYHMSDECASFDGKWNLMTLTEAGEAGCTPCADCGAEVYVYVAPTPEPTVEPTPVPDNSELPHKSAGELIVYHTSNGRSYHAAEKCRTMSGAKPYTLAESVAEGYGACGICNVPDEDIVNYPVVWVDETEVAHISDLCTYFEGECTVVTIYDAVKDDIAGCPYCGAGDYIAGETERLMELAKSAVVYYNNESTYYHTANTCVNMRSASEHNLYDALEKGLKHCYDCDPVELKDLDAVEADDAAEQTE